MSLGGFMPKYVLVSLLFLVLFSQPALSQNLLTPGTAKASAVDFIRHIGFLNKNHLMEQFNVYTKPALLTCNGYEIIIKIESVDRQSSRELLLYIDPYSGKILRLFVQKQAPKTEGTL